MTANKPLVSVIMPLYNSERYVAQALESVFNQDYQGYFRGKHYPQEYTRKERNKINLYSKLSESEMQRVKTYMGLASWVFSYRIT